MLTLFIQSILYIILISTQIPYGYVQKINTTAQFIVCDNLEYLYIYEHFNLLKYNPQGKLLSIYSNFSNGQMSLLDINDSYVLMAYYKDLNRVVFLDNQLAQIGNPINLDELGFYRIDGICKSKDFAIWIYNSFDKQLVKYGFNPRGIINQTNLDELNISAEKVSIQEWGNRLYLNTTHELYVFDDSGTFITRLDVEIPLSFQLADDKKMFYFADNCINIYSINENKTKSISLSFTDNIKNALLSNRHLYIQKQDLLEIYVEK